MSRDTRRSFLKVGAIAAAPLALAASAAAAAEQDHKARLARLEDEAAIRGLHQGWLRGFKGQGEVRSLRPDLEAAADEIVLAPDSLSARGRFHLTAEIASELPRDTTLAQMAHAQGAGVLLRTEPRVAKAVYAKGPKGWAMAKIDLGKS